MKRSIKFLSIALLLPTVVLAQKTSFSISGKIGSLPAPNKAYLFYTHPNGFISDSAAIINGSFSFKGTVNTPRLAYLKIGVSPTDKNAKEIKLFLEQSQVNVVSPDSPDHAVINGGPLNSDYNELQKALTSINQKNSVINQEYQASSPEKRKSKEFISDIEKRSDLLNKQEKVIDANFIRKHPDSWVSFTVLQQMAGAVPDVNEIGPLFDLLSADIKTSLVGAPYGAQLENMKKTAIGVMAPDFTENDTTGKAVSLHDFKGKYVLVDFWASWCGPCRAENPNVVKAYSDYKSKGLEILGVSLDDTGAKDKWIKAIRGDHVTWTQVSDLKGWYNEAASLYAVQAIPQNFLIDPSGKIIAKNLRGDELNKKLSELFIK